MDLATETAIKALVLGLQRSKAVNNNQLETIFAEFTFAVKALAERDADVAAEVAALEAWLRKATDKGDTGKKSLLSRF